MAARNEELRIKIRLDDTGKLSAELGGVEKQIRKTGAAGKDASGGLGSLTSALGSLKSLLPALGVGAVVTSLKSLTSTALETAGKLSDVASRTGLGAEAIQEYGFAAEQAGVASGGFERALDGFAKRVGEARAGTGSLVTILKKTDAAFLSSVQAAGSTEEALDLVFRKLAETTNAADRAALANAAFGRSGIELLPMLDQGAAGLEKMRQRARDLGIVISEDLVNKGDAAGDALAELGKAIRGNLNTALLESAPAIKSAAEGLTSLVGPTVTTVAAGLKTIADNADAVGIAFAAMYGKALLLQGVPAIITSINVAMNLLAKNPIVAILVATAGAAAYARSEFDKTMKVNDQWNDTLLTSEDRHRRMQLALEKAAREGTKLTGAQVQMIQAGKSLAAVFGTVATAADQMNAAVSGGAPELPGGGGVAPKPGPGGPRPAPAGTPAAAVAPLTIPVQVSVQQGQLQAEIDRIQRILDSETAYLPTETRMALEAEQARLEQAIKALQPPSIDIEPSVPAEKLIAKRDEMQSFLSGATLEQAVAIQARVDEYNQEIARITGQPPPPVAVPVGADTSSADQSIQQSADTAEAAFDGPATKLKQIKDDAGNIQIIADGTEANTAIQTVGENYELLREQFNQDNPKLAINVDEAVEGLVVVTEKGVEVRRELEGVPILVKVNTGDAEQALDSLKAEAAESPTPTPIRADISGALQAIEQLRAAASQPIVIPIQASGSPTLPISEYFGDYLPGKVAASAEEASLSKITIPTMLDLFVSRAKNPEHFVPAGVIIAGQKQKLLGPDTSSSPTHSKGEMFGVTGGFDPAAAFKKLIEIAQQEKDEIHGLVTAISTGTAAAYAAGVVGAGASMGSGKTGWGK